MYFYAVFVPSHDKLCHYCFRGFFAAAAWNTLRSTRGRRWGGTGPWSLAERSSSAVVDFWVYLFRSRSRRSTAVAAKKVGKWPSSSRRRSGKIHWTVSSADAQRRSRFSRPISEKLEEPFIWSTAAAPSPSFISPSSVLPTAPSFLFPPAAGARRSPRTPGGRCRKGEEVGGASGQTGSDCRRRWRDQKYHFIFYPSWKENEQQRWLTELRPERSLQFQGTNLPRAVWMYRSKVNQWWGRFSEGA